MFPAVTQHTVATPYSPNTHFGIDDPWLAQLSFLQNPRLPDQG